MLILSESNQKSDIQKTNMRGLSKLQGLKALLA